MCNIRARKAILLALPKSEYSQVKLLKSSHKIWKTLKANYEGDTYLKRNRIKYLHCEFQDNRMMEDESIRCYIGRISNIVARIGSCEGTKSNDEIIWQILKSMRLHFKIVTSLIQNPIIVAYLLFSF